MKKLIEMEDSLNREIKIAAILSDVTENQYVLMAIANQLKADAAPAKEEPETGTPTENPIVDTLIKGLNGEDILANNSIAHIRTGEPIEEHINAGRFLQQKHHPKGILSNGECLKRGDVYKYFVEEFPAEEFPAEEIF